MQRRWTWWSTWNKIGIRILKKNLVAFLLGASGVEDVGRFSYWKVERIGWPGHILK